MFDGGSTTHCEHADFSGYAYQIAKDLINRDNRDYLWFYTSDGYFLLFADEIGPQSVDGFYSPQGQDVYNYYHVQDLEADPPVDYWVIKYFEHTQCNVHDYDFSCIQYGSPKQYADLRSGGVYYAYFFSILVVAVINYRLFMHIWKWIYRRR